MKLIEQIKYSTKEVEKLEKKIMKLKIQEYDEEYKTLKEELKIINLHNIKSTVIFSLFFTNIFLFLFPPSKRFNIINNSTYHKV